MSRRPPRSTLFPSRRSSDLLLARALGAREVSLWKDVPGLLTADPRIVPDARVVPQVHLREAAELAYYGAKVLHRSEEHTSELQSQSNLVCRLLLEKKKMHAVPSRAVGPPDAITAAHSGHAVHPSARHYERPTVPHLGLLGCRCLQLPGDGGPVPDP